MDSFLLPFEEIEARIWLDDREYRSVELDYDDYLYFNRWLWLAKPSRTSSNWYAYRKRGNKSIYLHVAIHERRGIPRPSSKHVIVDHRDGNSLNCRKANLRWATKSQNRLNGNGKHPHDFED